MEDTKLFDLICRLIERSDSARASYANRAAIVLAANALILTTIAALIDKRTPHFKWNIVLLSLMTASLRASCWSVALALKAAVGEKTDSNAEANFPEGDVFSSIHVILSHWLKSMSLPLNTMN